MPYCYNNILLYCTSVAVVVPTVMSQTVLTSSMEQVCPGNTIVFTCTTNGSSLLAWISKEYIGTGSQIEFRSIIDTVGTVRNSTSNPETVANLTAINNDGMLILTSTLCIKIKSTTPNISVSCINAGGMMNTSTIPLAGMWMRNWCALLFFIKFMDSDVWYQMHAWFHYSQIGDIKHALNLWGGNAQDFAINMHVHIFHGLGY